MRGHYVTGTGWTLCDYCYSPERRCHLVIWNSDRLKSWKRRSRQVLVVPSSCRPDETIGYQRTVGICLERLLVFVLWTWTFWPLTFTIQVCPENRFVVDCLWIYVLIFYQIIYASSAHYLTVSRGFSMLKQRISVNLEIQPFQLWLHLTGTQIIMWVTHMC